MKQRNLVILSSIVTSFMFVACGGDRDHRLGGNDANETESTAPGGNGTTNLGNGGTGYIAGSSGLVAQGGSFDSGGTTTIAGTVNGTGGTGTSGSSATGGTGTSGSSATGGSGTGGSEAQGGFGGNTVQCAIEGVRACVGNAQRGRQVCQNQAWQSADCPEGQLCNSATTECQPILPACAGKQPGFAYCDEMQIRVCDADLLSSTVSELCGPGGWCMTLTTGPFCAHSIPQCTVEGSHRCKGNAQREREVCRTWAYQPDVACPTDQLCDSATGECQAILPECEGRTPGYSYCSGPQDIRTCGPDLVSSTLSTTCEFRCVEDATGAACSGAT